MAASPACSGIWPAASRSPVCAASSRSSRNSGRPCSGGNSAANVNSVRAPPGAATALSGSMPAARSRCTAERSPSCMATCSSCAACCNNKGSHRVPRAAMSADALPATVCTRAPCCSSRRTRSLLRCDAARASSGKEPGALVHALASAPAPSSRRAVSSEAPLPSKCSTSFASAKASTPRCTRARSSRSRAASRNESPPERPAPAASGARAAGSAPRPTSRTRQGSDSISRARASALLPPRSCASGEAMASSKRLRISGCPRLTAAHTAGTESP
mmetsp:Transcript_63987/g.181727  ORF Transcript_63987/g.181727 Transcript_63987/m.181727 type:complete len:274 (-) Transcript_63987:2473-3294(-)